MRWGREGRRRRIWEDMKREGSGGITTTDSGTGWRKKGDCVSTCRDRPDDKS